MQNELSGVKPMPSTGINHADTSVDTKTVTNIETAAAKVVTIANNNARELGKTENSSGNQQGSDKLVDYKNNIKNALNMMKKLDSDKDIWKTLKDRIPIPAEAIKTISNSGANYTQLIENFSHASASDKFKTIFIAKNMSSKEETRRKNLTSAVIAFGSAVDAYQNFFAGCSNIDKVITPLYNKFSAIINNLGPTGKKYIPSGEVLRKDPLWKTCLKTTWIQLSTLYNFKDVKFPKNILGSTLYRSHVIYVYQLCRDKATEFKDNLINELTNLGAKLKNNNSHLASKTSNLSSMYATMRTTIKENNLKLKELGETILKHPRIFGQPSISKKTTELLNNLSACMSSLNNASKIFARKIASSATKTDNIAINTHQKSLFNRATSLFTALKQLKLSLLNGNFTSAKSALANFTNEYSSATDDLAVYKQTLDGVNGDLHAVHANELKLIQNAKTKFDQCSTQFTTTINEAMAIPEKFKEEHTTKFIIYATKAISACSTFLCGYTALANGLVSNLGPIVGGKIADWYYGG